MLYLLYALFVLSCIVIIVSILLQPGKADAGALFTSSVSSTAFGPRGTQTLLAKITIGAAITFMLSALFISIPYFAGSRSVLQSVDEQPTTATTPAPAQPQSAPVAPVTTENNATTNADSATVNANGAQKAQPASDNKQANQNKK